MTKFGAPKRVMWLLIVTLGISMLVASFARTPPAAAATTVTWAGSASGAWETASNWNPQTVPGPGNDVVINTPGATITLSSSVTANSLTLQSGTLMVNGGLTLTSASSQSGGTLSGSGTVTIPAGATYTWTTGTMSGGTTAIASGGTLVISPSCCTSNLVVLDQRTLSNSGTVSWPSNSVGFTAQNGATINNQPGGVFDIQSNEPLLANGASPVFNNAGTLQKSAGGGTSTLNVNLINTGTVRVSSGVLALPTSSTNSGQLTVGGSGVLDMTAGTHTWNAGTTFGSGTGTVRLSGGTLNVTSNVTLPMNTVQTGGTLGGSGTVTIPAGATYTWTVGTMSSGTTTIASGGTLVISPSCCTSNLVVLDQRTLNNSGTVSWPTNSVGFTAQNGAIINNQQGGVFDIQSNEPLLAIGTPPVFNNAGTLQKSAGSGTSTLNVNLINSGTVSVSSGVVALPTGSTNSGQLVAGGSGVLDMTAGTHTWTAGTTFGNGTGTVRLSGGTLNVTADVTLPTNMVQMGGTLAGTGTLTIPAGATYTWTTGTMSGGTTAVASGGTLVISPTCCTSNLVVLDQRTLSNSGTVTWPTNSVGFTAQNGAIINNQQSGVFDIQSNEPLLDNGAPPVFNNAGTLQKSAGGGTSTLNVNLINSGTVRVSSGVLAIASGFSQSAAGTLTLQLAGNSCASPSRLDVTGGAATLGGALTITTGTGCAPASGQSFQAMTFRSASGQFASLTAPYVGTYTPTALTVTLEPGGVALSSPQRLVDTRLLGAPIAAGQSQCFTLAGQGGIPLSAQGVILNVTAVGYSDYGWLTLYPAGGAVPSTSTLNFDSHEYAIANGAIVRLGTGGQVCVNAGRSASHVALDVVGFLPWTNGQLQLLTQPQRVADTRTLGGPVASGASRCFAVSGVAGIPADASAILLNVTAVQYATPGWLTVYPNGQPVPGTSTLNFDLTEYAVANSAIVRVGTGGQVCANVGTVNSAPGSAQVVLDVTGYLGSGSGSVSMLASPQRVFDTRLAGWPVGSGQTQCVLLAGQAGVPANATGVILNVTAVGYSDFGWLTLYPAGQSLPSTSTLNFDTHEYAIANGAVIQLGADGRLCVNAGRSASHVVLDLVGYLSP
jgi:hypothetical protein